MPLLPWFSTPAPQEPPEPEQKHPPPALDEKIFSQLEQRLEDIPQPLLFVLSGILLAGAGAYTHRRFFRRLRTAEWITPDVFAQRRWIKGVVTSVGDADNFRLYHTPGFGWRWPVKFRRIPSNTKELKDQTIHIRIAGVDAPEAAHFGRASQPYSAESLAWLKNQILGQTLYCQLVRRDQYARVVSIVMQSPRVLPASLVRGKSLALEMLRAGWATTYEQAGAEYGKWGKEEFLRIEAQAKASRRGMWKDGVNIETPAQYKRRYAATDVETATASERSAEPRHDKPRWWRRF